MTDSSLISALRDIRKRLTNMLQQLSPEELNIETMIFVPYCESKSGEIYEDAFYNLHLFTKYDEQSKMNYPYFHIVKSNEIK